jgi:hypothetical protein
MTKPRCRHTWIWLPLGEPREIPRTGMTYAADLGLCHKCGRAKSRLHEWTPGDIASAMLWGRQFQLKRINGGYLVEPATLEDVS